MVDGNTLVPGKNITFDGCDLASIDVGNFVCRGFYSSRMAGGVYKKVGETLNPVVERGDPVPGIIDDFQFRSFESVAFDKGNVAVLGFFSTFPRNGIFFDIGGSLLKVIDTTDTLDGKEIQDRFFGFFGKGGLSGNQLVFRVEFADFSEAIYVATVIP